MPNSIFIAFAAIIASAFTHLAWLKHLSARVKDLERKVSTLERRVYFD